MNELIFKCNCGAVTVEHNGKPYNMMEESLPDYFPELVGVELDRDNVVNCNYCINNWGVDLCGCGSGEKFGECDNNLNECSRPIQDIELGIVNPTRKW